MDFHYDAAKHPPGVNKNSILGARIFSILYLFITLGNFNYDFKGPENHWSDYVFFILTFLLCVTILLFPKYFFMSKFKKGKHYARADRQHFTWRFKNDEGNIALTDIQSVTNNPGQSIFTLHSGDQVVFNKHKIEHKEKFKVYHDWLASLGV